MKSYKYILDGHMPVVCDDVMQWGRWMQDADRRVSQTEIGDAEVSTVFLGLDHSWDRSKPLLFETMVFGGSLSGEVKRYSTWDEAQAGHDAMVERVKQS